MPNTNWNGFLFVPFFVICPLLLHPYRNRRKMNLKPIYTALIFLPLLVVSTVGCGPWPISTVEVKGTVTYKGQPVEGAQVMFSPIEAEEGALPAYGTTDAQGKFTLQTQLGAVGAGTTPGMYKVAISKSRDVGTGKFMRSPEGNQVEILKGEDLLPIKYKFSSGSPITETIVEGKVNEFTFALE